MRGTDLGDATFAALARVLTAQGKCASARGFGVDSSAARPRPGLSVLQLGHNPRVAISGFRALARGVRAAGPWFEGVCLVEYGEPGDDDMIDETVKAEGARLLEAGAAVRGELHRSEPPGGARYKGGATAPRSRRKRCGRGWRQQRWGDACWLILRGEGEGEKAADSHQAGGG